MGSVTGSFERKERRGVGAMIEGIEREEGLSAGDEGSISGWCKCNYVTQTFLDQSEKQALSVYYSKDRSFLCQEG